MIVYSEPNSTFTHQGSQYDLTGLLAHVDGSYIHPTPISLLSWIFKHCPMTADDADRIFSADLRTPIIVMPIENENGIKIVVLDGVHRLAKAMLTGVYSLPTYTVGEDTLKRFKI